LEDASLYFCMLLEIGLYLRVYGYGQVFLFVFTLSNSQIELNMSKKH